MKRHPFKRLVAKRYISTYERELNAALRALDGYWHIYIPQDDVHSAPIDDNLCRHETRTHDGSFAQCRMQWSETINGYHFCDRHALIVYEYLDRLY